MKDHQDPVIIVKNTTKTFSVREKPIRNIRDIILNLSQVKAKKHQILALEGINFTVNKGEVIGIIGRNGSGKSTLLNLVMGSMKPDKGSFVETHGRIIRLALGMGFDPSLSTRHNVYVNGSILGLTFKKIGSLFEDIIGFADLQGFEDTPIKFYSSGMRTRLAFSIAIHADADIFLMDEVFGGVGDENFKKKSEKVFKDTFLKNRTILFVSHGLANIAKHSTKVLLIDKGKQIMFGEPKAVIAKYKEIIRRH